MNRLCRGIVVMNCVGLAVLVWLMPVLAADSNARTERSACSRQVSPEELAAVPKLSDREVEAQLAFVRAVLKAPTEGVDKETSQRFLYRVVPYYLPADDCEKYLRRRSEFLSAGKANLFKRRPQARQAAPKEDEPKTDTAQVLLLAGYKEITKELVDWLCMVTKCSLEQLIQHSSLKIIGEIREGKRVERYFIHGKDPLFAMLVGKRGSGGPRGTNLFGIEGGSYCR